MAYAMYADAKGSASIHTVEAELVSGEVVELTQETVGVKYFAWRNHYVYAFAQGDFSRVPAMLEMVEQRHGSPARRVELKTLDVVVEDGELREITGTILVHPREDAP